MSQDYGIPVPAAHATATPHAEPARYLVIIDEDGTALARLFLENRHEVAQFDAGAQEVSLMSEGLAASQDAADPAWDEALSSHTLDERRAAQVYRLDV